MGSSTVTVKAVVEYNEHPIEIGAADAVIFSRTIPRGCENNGPSLESPPGSTFGVSIRPLLSV